MKTKQHYFDTVPISGGGAISDRDGTIENVGGRQKLHN